MPNTRQIKFEDASIEDLRLFAKQSLGFELHKNCNLDTAREKVREAFQGPWFVIDIPADQIDAEQKAKDAILEKKQIVEFSALDEPGGQDPVPVSINGRAKYIIRGVPAAVAKKYLLVIDGAERHAYTQTYDAKGRESGISLLPKRTKSYPYSVINPNPSPAEIAEADRAQQHELLRIRPDLAGQTVAA